MSPRDSERAQHLKMTVMDFASNTSSLPGLNGVGRLDALVGQFIASLRRIEFIHHVRDARHDPQRMNPASDMFDPLRAAVLYYRQGNIDEAWWLVFLATHFGKHGVDGWRLARDIYGKLGQSSLWNWATISANPNDFKVWLTANEVALTDRSVSRRFSNHRKYESLRATSNKGIAAVFASYVTWVAPPRTHNDIIRQTHKVVGQHPETVFETLYHSMNSVQRFGRLGKFDFLTMLGKLGIAPIEPGSTFLTGATGPLAGARLLFGGWTDASLSARALDVKLIDFSRKTGLGMQVLEDSLCNWQKSPDVYISFRG